MTRGQREKLQRLTDESNIEWWAISFRGRNGTVDTFTQSDLRGLLELIDALENDKGKEGNA